MRRRSYLPSLVTAGVLLLFLTVATFAWASTHPTTSAAERTGYDPLSPAEQSLAREAALKFPGVSTLLAGAQRTELLRVERHEEPKSVTQRGVPWPRRADVFVYNYDQDTLIQAIVNVHTGVVDSVQAVTSVQLPLTPAEIVAALNLALIDAQAGTILREQYRQITGADLTRVDQVEANGFVFHADSMPDVATGPMSTCGVHRCAQLLIHTPDRILLPASPIVDLSRQTVVRAGN